tara:strand:- start:52 stop:363 length:312 start_codon:yes stop_codon:yes gene_type:complete
MSEKIHVGFMMENLDCSVYLSEMTTDLASEDAVERHLLLTEKRKVSFRAKVLEKVRSEGIVRVFSKMNDMKSIRNCFYNWNNYSFVRRMEPSYFGGNRIVWKI